jgi:hypothetical protein
MPQGKFLKRVLLAAMPLTITSGAQNVNTKSLRGNLTKQGFTGCCRASLNFVASEQRNATMRRFRSTSTFGKKHPREGRGVLV